ncbi:diguanylate cyclase domain-containing protein [Actinotalea sp. C106]|uniref:diguanylate cyclase domain-containing protein n=1 Tax=Actinotalea sp. C106 TaxID=2908644 RepID=UPI0020279CFA|nr:diguanylate cyclase [Actinotalea sp. C106]
MPDSGVPEASGSEDLTEILDLLSERIARYRVSDLVLVYCNASWAAQHEATPDELVGRRLEELLSPAEVEGLHTQLERLGPDAPFLYDPVPRPAPHVPDRWVEWADRWLPGPDGPQVLAVGRDVTDRHRAEEQLAVSEAHFRDLADRSADVVWRFTAAPEPRLSYLSPSVLTLTGWSGEDFGADLEHLVAVVDEDGRELLDDAMAGLALPERYDLRLRRPDGTWVVLEVQMTRLPDGLQGVARDVTEIRGLQSDLAHLALRDPLTGLANRRLLDLLLRAALARVRHSGGRLIATYVDLEDFKLVNDRYGHQVGDTVLVEAARRLTQAVPEADVVARLGGDEFLVVHEAAAPTDRPDERVLAALAPAYLLPDGTSVRCGATVGVATTGALEGEGAGPATTEALIAAADAAMYAAKPPRDGLPGVLSPSRRWPEALPGAAGSPPPRQA